ncbi:MAG TPA: ArsR family transcriptional regulator [Micromonosporaceae bacterium]|nr:ArsR family transcriptional regulator [Micromonosporaceae bacterium]
MALAVLRRPGVHAAHVPWLSWARPRLAEVPDLKLLLSLVAHDTHKPAFLMPPPDSRMPTLEAELRRVRAAQRHQEIDRIVNVLRQCFELTIEPHWERMTRLLEADIAYRATILAEGGAERLFTDLHREVIWEDGALVVHPDRAPKTVTHVKLGGHGLVLCPSVFCWPRVSAAVQPVAAGTLRYPARGVATLWEKPEPAPQALAALLGRNRAALLTALQSPHTTADLARLLDVTPGAISQHLGVLRDAGLVSSHRDGRAVLHLRTERAQALLG